MGKERKCTCGSEEFYNFRVAGSTTTNEHWSLECAECGKVLETKRIFYGNETK